MGNKYFDNNDHKLKEVRQFLRVNANDAEKILWKYLRRNQLGYKFRRQFSIENFVADFCSVQLKLAIEIDGWTHDSQKTQIKDGRKTHVFEANGYKVIRFTNEQIRGDIELVMKEVGRVCKKRANEVAEPLSPSLP